MSLGDEKVAALASVVKTILETGNSSRAVIDKFAAALHQAGLPKEAELVHHAASVLWGEPSDVDRIVAYFEDQAAKERALLDSGRCNNLPLAQERWMVYKASAQEVRARSWDKAVCRTPQAQMQDLSYATIDDLVQLIAEPNRAAIQKILADNRELFGKVHGSTHNHQAWPGGYLDHVTEVMNVARVLYRQLDALRPLPFALSDILLVVFLHDIEKPWKYEVGPDGQLQHKATMLTKIDHQRFRMAKLAEYGVVLTDDHENGLKYAEGELDDYSSRERKMRPLAALAHLCDVTSARIWFDHPASTGDPWKGAKRT